jgi:integral membrane protein (TIGR01906 family)
MKKTALWALSVTFGLSLILTLLLNAADSVVFNLNQYQKEYEKYNRPAVIGISMDDLMDVTGRLLDYMKGRQPDIVIEKEIGGVVREVFGERERLHMVDVRSLVLSAMNLRAACAAVAALSLAGLVAWKRKKAADWLSRGILWALVGWGALFTALAVYLLIDFSGAFWNFHLLFFNNDLWLLDPATDVMINMFPEEFFYDMAIGIVWRALLFIALPAAAAIVWLRREKLDARRR